MNRVVYLCPIVCTLPSESYVWLTEVFHELRLYSSCSQHWLLQIRSGHRHSAGRTIASDTTDDQAPDHLPRPPSPCRLRCLRVSQIDIAIQLHWCTPLELQNADAVQVQVVDLNCVDIHEWPGASSACPLVIQET